MTVPIVTLLIDCVSYSWELDYDYDQNEGNVDSKVLQTA